MNKHQSLYTSYKFKEHRNFWKSQVPAFSEEFYFTQKKETNEGANVRRVMSTSLDAKLAEEITMISNKNDMGIFVILLSAYALLIHKYTGSLKIIIDSPSFGEVKSEQVPLLLEINRNQSFREFLSYVQEKIKSTYKYQDYPSDLLKDSDDGLPLFSTNLGIVNKNIHKVDINSDNYDVLLETERIEDRIECHWSYNTAVFDELFIDRAFRNFQKIISEINNLNIGLDEINILTSEDVHELNEFNKFSPPFSIESNIVKMFEEQVVKSPNKTAVQFQTTSLTYQQLNNKVNALAHSLINDYGVKPNEVIGVLLERSERLIIALLAIWKAGAAYTPLDPQHPDQRKIVQLEDAEVQVLLTDSEFLFDVSYFKGKLLALDVQLPLLQENEQSPNLDTSKFQRAYLLYTSGSTGVPKAVQIGHDSLTNYLTWFSETYPIKEEDSTLLFSSIAFDLTYTSLWSALINGATLYLSPNTDYLDIDLLTSQISEYNISYLKLTPSQFRMIVEDEKFDEKILSYKLRLVVLGGEKIRPLDVSKYIERSSDTVFVNHYGPTESTIGIASCPINVESIQKFTKNPVVGKPISNVHFHVVNDFQEILPVGMKGELCVSGKALALGYLNRSELSDEKFKEIEAADGSRIRAYLTGDLVRWNENGHLEFIDRLDNQLKINGYRIEAEEIESSILKHEGVDNVAVVPKSTNDGDEFLVAYYESQEEISSSSISSYLQELLPRYMIPNHWVRLDRLPLSASGKLLVKGLPEPVIDDASQQTVKPTNELETLLVETWQKVLGIEQIGTEDDFFKIGGDSIKAIQIASRMHQKGYKVEVKDIFEWPNIVGLAAIVEPYAFEIDQDSVSGAIPFTPIQHEFFELQSKPSHFNQSVMLDFENKIDPAIVKLVFEQIVEHHDMLRAVVRFDEKESVQQMQLDKSCSISLDVFDEVNPEDIENEILLIQSSIDLENGPLFKLAVFNRKGEKFQLLIVAHHMVIDGVSWRILIEDLTLLLSAFEKGEEISLPPKTNSFMTWSEQLTVYSNSKECCDKKEFWKKQELLKHPLIPKDFQITNEDNFIKNVGIKTMSLSEEITELLLKDSNRPFFTETNDLLITALARTNHIMFGHHEMSLLMEGHGREPVLENININRTIGWFTSNYPMVFELPANDELKSQIKSIKEQLRGIPNKGIDYGILKYLTDELKKEDLKFSIKPQIKFNYMGEFNQEFSAFKIAEEPIKHEFGEHIQRYADVDVFSIVTDNQMHISFMYNKNLFEPDTILKWLNTYTDQLKEITSYCSAYQKEEHTPSDFKFKGLTQNELDSIFD